LHLFSQPGEFERREDSFDRVEQEDRCGDIDIAETNTENKVSLEMRKKARRA